MTRAPEDAAVAEFYETHPIGEKQILDRLRADGIDLATLTEDTLRDHDQDHFGGAAANDILAALAGLDAACEVLDVCCGLGGPSRDLAAKFGCRVTGIDFTESRIEGAKRLTAMTGLADLARFVQGDARDLPMADRTFDVVIGQEAFCHVPDKDRLVSECVRVLKPGGRIAFTDILATDAMTPATRDRLRREMTYRDLGTLRGYVERLEGAGCDVIATDDLSDEWRAILVDRLAMYRGLKDQTVERFGAAHFAAWDGKYGFFVERYATGELGGGRFLARRRTG